MRSVIFVLSVIVALLAAPDGFSCTTFVLKGDGKIYLGKNFDWNWENGLVIANPRGLKKTALVSPGHPAAQWTSKYGSVTLNQFGLEKPYAGMNEAGLVVESLLLYESRYPIPDSRPEIDTLQWIQYQLDTCSNVAEVIATDAKIRQAEPAFALTRAHYLICDARGDCAAIEFLRGKMVVHHGQDMPYSALANNNYAESAAYARTNPLPQRSSEGLKDPGSLPLFACAASRAASFRARTPGQDVAYAFEILEQVRRGKGTVVPTLWQVVYDIPNREIHYRTASNPDRRTTGLSSFDFARSRTVQFAGIEASPSAAGYVEFSELTEARHRKYLETLFRQESLRKVRQEPLKKGLGDFTPLIDAYLAGLRAYTFSPPQP